MAPTNRKPKLIGFDLDYTLWPFWIDTHVTPPFRKDKKGILDSRGRKVKIYPEVLDILKKLKDEGYILAAVSRTSEIDGAYNLLQQLDWDKYFTHKEIYPGCKITHFKKIQKESGLAFQDMLFFDDEMRNKRDLDTIGVMMILVNDGVNAEVVKQGLQEYGSSKPISHS